MNKCLYGILLVIFVLGAKPTNAQSYSSKEIKAAFICNFAKFTSWPKNKQTDYFIIGIVGESNYTEVLKKMAGNIRVSNKKIRVIEYENPAHAKAAHLVYVGDIAKGIDKPGLLRSLALSNVLTIGEELGFCSAGGTINFSSKQQKYGFQIRKNYNKTSSFVISTKLLKLATLVE